MSLFGFISERESSYRGVLAFSVMLCVGMVPIIYITAVSTFKKSEDYQQSLVEIQNCERGYIKTKAGATFSTKKWKTEKALLIETNKHTFYVHKNYSEEWRNLQNALKQNDRWLFFFQTTDDGENLEVVEIRKQGDVIFALEKRFAIYPYILAGEIFFFLLLVWLIYKLVKTRQRILSDRQKN